MTEFRENLGEGFQQESQIAIQHVETVPEVIRFGRTLVHKMSPTTASEVSLRLLCGEKVASSRRNQARRRRALRLTSARLELLTMAPRAARFAPPWRDLLHPAAAFSRK